MDHLVERIFAFFEPLILLAGLLIMAGALFIGLPAMAWWIWQDEKSPTFDLRKDEWACSASHRVTTDVLVGKIIVPSESTVCDQWTRRA